MRYHRFFGLFARFFLALLLSARPAHAQQFQLDSVRAADTGGIYLPAAHRALVHRLAHRRGVTTVHHYALDEQLRPRHHHALRLPGRYHLISSGANRHHLLYQLRRRGSDSVVTALLDSTGRTVALRRQHARLLRWQELGSIDAPLAEGFLLTEPDRAGGGVVVRRLGAGLQAVWQHRFVSESGGAAFLDHAVADSTHLWVVISSNALSRRASRKAYCLDLATGRVLTRLALDSPTDDAMRHVPGIAAPGSGHSLRLAGYAYAHRRASRTHSGDLFYLQLGPDSTRRHHRVALRADGPLRTVRPKIYWQAMTPDSAGHVRLVGETYTSTSYAGYLATTLAVRTLLLGVAGRGWTTLRPREVLSLRLPPAGPAAEVRVLPLPDGGAYHLWGYLPARYLAEAAAAAGTFRVRGLTPDAHRVVLRTPRRLLTYDLRTAQPTTVYQLPRTGRLEFWHATAQHLLVYHQERRRLTLQLVPYPPAAAPR